MILCILTIIAKVKAKKDYTGLKFPQNKQIQHHACGFVINNSVAKLYPHIIDFEMNIIVFA
jgi:hypothetical protein